MTGPILATYEVVAPHGTSYGYHGLPAALAYFNHLEAGELRLVTWRTPDRHGPYTPCCEVLERR